MLKKLAGYTHHLQNLVKSRKIILRKNIAIKSVEHIKSLYTDSPILQKNSSKLDEVTWEDLDLNALFVKFCTCFTTAGQHWLYSCLQSPMQDGSQLQKRITAIKDLKNFSLTHKKESNRLNHYLNRIGQTQIDCLYCLKHLIRPNSYLLLALYSLRMLLLISIFGSILNVTTSIMPFTSIWFPFLLTMLSLNTLVYYAVYSKIKLSCEALIYILSILRETPKISMILKDCLPNHSVKLNSLFKSMKALTRHGRGMTFLEGAVIFADYYNLVTFIKPISYLKSASHLKFKAHEANELYTLIGEVDTLWAIVALHTSPTSNDSVSITFPEFNLVDVKENIGIKALNLYHPLVEKPIGNDIHLTNGMIITGSNMSGKSTFLRSLAINALCAQTICTVFADNYQTERLHIISSISLNDDLSKGKSYYLMEAEAILRMVSSSKHTHYKHFYLIDEIFKGTNPVERLAAAQIILKELASRGDLIAVSTHDYHLCETLDSYDPYYFSENVSSNHLSFNFTLQKGLSYTRNAIKVLDYLGYPKHLTRDMSILASQSSSYS